MWHLLTDNAQAISTLYHEVPPLTSVDLVKLSLDHDGPVMEVYVELAKFPDHPPLRWRKNNYNAVQLRLDLYVLHSITISGWSNIMLVDIDIQKTKENDILFTAKGNELKLIVVCQAIRIVQVSGYQTEKY